MASIRVALAQLNLQVGDFDSNVAAITDAYDRSVASDADLVVFSELAVCAYPPEDLLLKQRFIDDAQKAVASIAQHTSDAVAIVGFPEQTDQGLYNSAAVCHRGEVRGVYRKRLLPNYSVFDEKRYFVAGTSDGPLFEIAGVLVSICVCEDLWFTDGPFDGQIESGAALGVSINGSPYQRGKNAERATAVIEATEKHKVPIVYVNQVGGQDELIFDGSSFVADANGKVIARLPQFEEAVGVVDVEVPSSEWGALPVIVTSRERQNRKPIMKSLDTIPIEPAHSALLQMLDPFFSEDVADLTEENLQSRIRGVLLMALSNKKGWLVLTTGNKSETSVGYSTLYGDTAGGFAVLKDCPKLLVYELCRWRNNQTSSPWIPEASISKPPSAELRPEQTDEQSLPSYELLDPLLQAYIEEDRAAADLISDGYDAAMVERITRLVDLAEYKRRQSPPGPRISAKAFGKDRRLPITNRYR